MDIGMILPRIDPDNRPLTTEGFLGSIDRIEAVGFDSIWITDSIGRGFPNPDPLVALAVAAARTDRVRLGTSILQVAIRHPVELAHRVMSTHMVARDRLCLGVGAGSTMADFEATGSEFEGRFARFEESLRTMRALWKGDVVDGVSLSPFDVTLGGPEVLIGSWGGSRWIPKAAKEYDGWVGSARKTNWSVMSQGIERFRAAGGGRAVMTNVVVDPRVADQPDTEDGELDPCSMKIAAERLRRFRDLGFDEVVLRTMDHTDEVVADIAELALSICKE